MDIEYFVIFKPVPGKSTVEYSFVEKDLLDELINSGEVAAHYETTHGVHTKAQINEFINRYANNQ
jgi:hypothetical protein